NNNSSSSSSSAQALDEAGVLINFNQLDDMEGNGTAANARYTDSKVSVGSSANDNEAAKLDKLTYQAYDTFSRTTWNLSGIEAGFPATDISVDDNKISILFTGVTTDSTRLLESIEVPTGAIERIDAFAEDGDLLFELTAVDTS